MTLTPTDVLAIRDGLSEALDVLAHLSDVQRRGIVLALMGIVGAK